MLGGAAAAEAQGNVSIAVEQYVLPGHMAAWEEAVKEGLQTAMKQLKWRKDAKKVIYCCQSSGNTSYLWENC